MVARLLVIKQMKLFAYLVSFGFIEFAKTSTEILLQDSTLWRLLK